jgi:hypothetical protein
MRIYINNFSLSKLVLIHQEISCAGEDYEFLFPIISPPYLYPGQLSLAYIYKGFISHISEDIRSSHW